MDARRAWRAICGWQLLLCSCTFDTGGLQPSDAVAPKDATRELTRGDVLLRDAPASDRPLSPTDAHLEGLFDQRREQSPLDQRPTDHKPTDHKPLDQRPTDHKPTDHKPTDQRPPDQRPPDQRPLDQRPPDLRPPDQRPPDQRPPDLKQPDLKPPPPSCASKYGAAGIPGFKHCSETATACAFYFSASPPASCASQCQKGGGTCIKSSYDSSDGCAVTGDGNCSEQHGDAVCTCSR